MSLNFSDQSAADASGGDGDIISKSLNEEENNRKYKTSQQLNKEYLKNEFPPTQSISSLHDRSSVS